MNFNLKTFYSHKLKYVATFYRNGWCVMTNNENEEPTLQQIINHDLGEMCLIFDKLLVAKSSKGLLQFRYKKKKWTHSETWSEMALGTISYAQGSDRFQIIDETKIFFYTIDRKTLALELENIMYNFMACQRMLFAHVRSGRFCVTFTREEPDFNVFIRRQFNNF